MTRRDHILFASVCAALLNLVSGLKLHAQPLPCDSLNTTTFSYADLGGYLYSFVPTDPAGMSTFSTEWAFLGEDFSEFSFLQQVQVAFPSEGNYLVCLRAVLLDDQQAACTSIHCELVPLPVDSLCSGLQPAFTIGVQGGAITFIDQTASTEPVQSFTWDFGDGSGSTEVAPDHVYSGMGPYQVCMTVTTANCTATACNWIYLGPADVPCDTLLHASVGVIQFERTVAVFDQSVTSGMNSSVHWQFGDGDTASGSPVTHTYAEDGDFNICGSVALWGTLTTDTCTAQACLWVSTVQNSAAVDQATSRRTLRAFPVPFRDKLTIEGGAPGARWTLMDVLGCIHAWGIVPVNGVFPIKEKELPSGVYFIRVASWSGAADLRVIKEE